jgi:hypothetical protein
VKFFIENKDIINPLIAGIVGLVIGWILQVNREIGAARFDDLKEQVTCPIWRRFTVKPYISLLSCNHLCHILATVLE